MSHPLLPDAARLAAPLLALCCLLALLPRAASAKEDPGYRNTPQWHRVVSLWHVLLDHSQGTVYNSEGFKALSTEVEKAESDLRALQTKGLLSQEVSAGLALVLRSRYDFLRDRCYGASQAGRQDEMEAALAASRWVVEMQLGLLHQQSLNGLLDDKLMQAVRTNLTTEMTFQRSAAALQGQLSAKQSALDKDDQKDNPAQAKHLQDSQQRRYQLLEKYETHRLPRDRAAQTLVPYLMELTTTRP